MQQTPTSPWRGEVGERRQARAGRGLIRSPHPAHFARDPPPPGEGDYAARLCISLAPSCAPRIAATERSIADHSRATSWPAAESGATSPALNPAASEAM